MGVDLEEKANIAEEKKKKKRDQQRERDAGIGICDIAFLLYYSCILLFSKRLFYLLFAYIRLHSLILVILLLFAYIAYIHLNCVYFAAAQKLAEEEAEAVRLEKERAESDDTINDTVESLVAHSPISKVMRKMSVNIGLFGSGQSQRNLLSGSSQSQKSEDNGSTDTSVRSSKGTPIGLIIPYLFLFYFLFYIYKTFFTLVPLIVSSLS